VNISKTKKGIPKRKTPFFFALKSLSNQQQLFFTSYLIRTKISKLNNFTKSKYVFIILWQTRQSKSLFKAKTLTDHRPSTKETILAVTAT